MKLISFGCAVFGVVTRIEGVVVYPKSFSFLETYGIFRVIYKCKVSELGIRVVARTYAPTVKCRFGAYTLYGNTAGVLPHTRRLCGAYRRDLIHYSYNYGLSAVYAVKSRKYACKTFFVVNIVFVIVCNIEYESTLRHGTVAVVGSGAI